MRQPAIFFGHGSPMNALGGPFADGWRALGEAVGKPGGVLMVSAHWETLGLAVTAQQQPETIHDFGGFPKALFDVQYPAPGNPKLAQETAALFKTTHVEMDHDWGLDHGTWTIVRHMYPEANIPVLQLSIDYTKGPQYHYELSKELAGLRKKGVLIVGSGNMVHNLRLVAWDKINEPEYGFDWAVQMNTKFKDLISNGSHDKLIKYESLGKEAMLAIPTPEHYWPLLYTLGLKGSKEAVSFFNDRVVGGSLTMTSVKIG